MRCALIPILAVLAFQPISHASSLSRFDKITNQQDRIDYAKKALEAEVKRVKRKHIHRSTYGGIMPEIDEGLWLFTYIGALTRANRCTEAESEIAGVTRNYMNARLGPKSMQARYFSSLFRVFANRESFYNYSITDYSDTARCAFSGKLLTEREIYWLASTDAGNAEYLKYSPALSEKYLSMILEIESFNNAASEIFGKISHSIQDPLDGISARRELWSSMSRVATKHGLNDLSNFYEAAALNEDLNYSRMSDQIRSDRFWSDLTQIAGMMLQQMPGNKSPTTQLLAGMMVNGENSVSGQQMLDAIIEQAIRTQTGNIDGLRKGSRNASGKCVDVDSSSGGRILPDSYCDGAK